MKCKKLSKERLKQLKKLTLMNNAFMNLVLENNNACVEEILRVILGKNDLTVKKVQTQKMFQGFNRSIYLDVYAEDSKGVRYNIEIQRSDEGASPRRTRFHTGMIDVHSLKAGQDFKELPEVYVIFITLNDVLGLNQSIYTIHKYIDGILKPFEDGSHVIYINTSAKDDGTEISKLIHDLRCPNADEMFFPRLAARVKFFKDNEEGTENMGDYFENLQKKAIENVALNFIQLGTVSLEDIAKNCGLTLRRVQTLAKRINSKATATS